ncbi:unnamed protein product [Ceratitis capitata]|uniref:(Mediterranean fruit fly) hypothetical protein n=1 Tax=Ceratitis capitata TaxID=7213 RepID=A0A811V6C8_CERCA|nr:unnamed protein product [Ceratitis capitata]
MRKDAPVPAGDRGAAPPSYCHSSSQTVNSRHQATTPSEPSIPCFCCAYCSHDGCLTTTTTTTTTSTIVGDDDNVCERGETGKGVATC